MRSAPFDRSGLDGNTESGERQRRALAFLSHLLKYSIQGGCIAPTAGNADVKWTKAKTLLRETLMNNGLERGQRRRDVRVAIVGGGCAGMAAAWQLSKLSGYEVTVYESSSRLGGKCASSRDYHGRIHEHGLHVWLGFYENAFRMMRECYKEVESRGWGPDALPGDRLSHRSIEDAFFSEPNIGVAIPAKRSGDGSQREWTIWNDYLPPGQGLPGEDFADGTAPFSVVGYLLRCFELLKTLMHSSIGAPRENDLDGSSPSDTVRLQEALTLGRDFDASNLLDWTFRVVKVGGLTLASVLSHAVALLEILLKEFRDGKERSEFLLDLMIAVVEGLRGRLSVVAAVDDIIRRKTEIFDIVIAIAIGVYRDRLLLDRRGFDAINHLDYREWLLRHGAAHSAVHSQFINGIYDFTFAFHGGDRGKPALAAGVALRGAFRMFFTYRGAMFWRMRSGMGDAVFAPLYKVLKARNVGFRFRHSLEDIGFDFSEDKGQVVRLSFKSSCAPDDLAKLERAGLDSFGCWPEAAGNGTESQLETLVLNVGEDFDAVIMAIGVDDFVKVVERSGFFDRMPPSWSRMRDNVKTVSTQSVQVWLSLNLQELGWRRGSGIITGFDAPFDTWADMTHTLATEEDWRVSHSISVELEAEPKSVAYFCGALEDFVDESEAFRKVAENVKDLFIRGVKPVWPAAFENEMTTYDCMVGEPYVQANTVGSARYTISPPGSPQFRISPLDRSLLNMTVAGDWTSCGLDFGCVEAAVISGMLAAHATTGGEPALSSIVGYDHP